MNKLRVQLSSLLALSLLAFGIIALANFKTTAQQVTTPNVLAVDPTLREIANYRQWTRANENPLEVFNPGSVAV